MAKGLTKGEKVVRAIRAGKSYAQAARTAGTTMKSAYWYASKAGVTKKQRKIARVKTTRTYKAKAKGTGYSKGRGWFDW